MKKPQRRRICIRVFLVVMGTIYQNTVVMQVALSLASIARSGTFSLLEDCFYIDKICDMRKRSKSKLRSCSLCKPHKTGHDCRWKTKDLVLLKEFE
jgi:hypothetical protein